MDEAIERAARAAWDTYAQHEGIRLSFDDLHRSAQSLWLDLAAQTVKAYKTPGDE